MHDFLLLIRENGRQIQYPVKDAKFTATRFPQLVKYRGVVYEYDRVTASDVIYQEVKAHLLETDDE